MADDGNELARVPPSEESPSAGPSGASTTMVVNCPHCEAEIEVQVQMQAAVVPLPTLPFTSAEEFALWLKASALSVEEFQRLPVYKWHRDQLEPLVRAVVDAGVGDSPGTSYAN